MEAQTRRLHQLGESRLNQPGLFAHEIGHDFGLSHLFGNIYYDMLFNVKKYRNGENYNGIGMMSTTSGKPLETQILNILNTIPGEKEQNQTINNEADVKGK